MRAWALVAAATALACTTFEPIARERCGNGLLEPGEDCDSPAASCVACAVMCGSAADCPNASYACGVDGACHAPSGKLAPATDPALDLVDEVRVTDIDRDGIGDVLGVSANAIDLRFGDPRATLVTTARFVTPPQSGPVAFGDLDRDGALDPMLATFDGVVAFESPFGALAPAIDPSTLVTAGFTVDKVFSISPAVLGVIGEAEDMQHVRRYVIGLISADANTFDHPALPLCPVGDGGFAAGNVDVAAIANNGTLDVDLSLWLNGASGPRLCAYALHVVTPPSLPGQHVTRAVTLFDTTPPGAPPATKPVWADLDFDNDPCPALVDSSGGGSALVMWDGTMTGAGGAHCGLATSTTALPPLPGAGSDAIAIGRIPLVPGVGFIESDLLVMSNGLYTFVDTIVPPVTPFEVSAFQRTIAGVETADLDGNGSTDAVLRARDDSDLDVLFREDQNGQPGYVIERLTTDGAVGQVALADFDGNGITDVAYVEDLLTHDALSVAYGDPGHVLHTTPEAVFQKVVDLATIDVPDAFDPEGRVGDLFVGATLGSGGLGIALLHGSPERTLTSFFDPRASTDPLGGAPVQAVVTGHFAPTATAAGPLDAVVFVGAGSASLAPTATVYRLDGTADGLEPTDPVNTGGRIGMAASGQTLAMLAACGATAGSAGPPCLPDVRIASWPIAADHDVIIGVDRAATPTAFLVDPWPLTGAGVAMPASQPELTRIARSVPGLQVQGLFPVDRAGTGALSLVATFAPGPGTTTDVGVVAQCTMSPDGTASACVDLSDVVRAALPNVTCTDAAPGHFAPGGVGAPSSAGADLVVLCHDATGNALLARVTTGSAGDAATLLAPGLGQVRRVTVGDVTGDGLDDVVILRGDGAARTIAVLPQCGTHDAACIAGAVTK